MAQSPVSIRIQPVGALTEELPLSCYCSATTIRNVPCLEIPMTLTPTPLQPARGLFSVPFLQTPDLQLPRNGVPCFRLSHSCGLSILVGKQSV